MSLNEFELIRMGSNSFEERLETGGGRSRGPSCASEQCLFNTFFAKLLMYQPAILPMQKMDPCSGSC